MNLSAGTSTTAEITTAKNRTISLIGCLFQNRTTTIPLSIHVKREIEANWLTGFSATHST